MNIRCAHCELQTRSTLSTVTPLHFLERLQCSLAQLVFNGCLLLSTAFRAVVLKQTDSNTPRVASQVQLQQLQSEHEDSGYISYSKTAYRIIIFCLWMCEYWAIHFLVCNSAHPTFYLKVLTLAG